MKYLVAILFLLCFNLNLNAQSIYESAESNSGLIAGNQSRSIFSGLSYSSSSNAFKFNYKTIRQRELVNTYPNFNSHNFEVSITLNEGTTSLVSEGKWNGEFGLLYNLSVTQDKSTESSTKTVKTIIEYIGGPGKSYDSAEECFKAGSINCVPNEKSTTEYIPTIKQSSINLAFENKLSKLSVADITLLEKNSLRSSSPTCRAKFRSCVATHPNPH
jgi:hypothetical protein